MLGSFVKMAPPDVFAWLLEKLQFVTDTKAQEAEESVHPCGRYGVETCTAPVTPSLRIHIL